ncbi:MAG: PH domain-containing protein [Burkholderiales bacterium]|nr:PH domain-containing protein [Opitutaceae bacterium]
MGLISHLFGNATEVDNVKVQAQLAPVLAPGEQIGRAFKIFRDLFVFTDHRLILVDKQGLTGSKVMYHSILYRSITQFSVETAGNFDADSELKIWTNGGLALQKEFKRGTDIVGLQQHLGYCIFGGGAAK